MDNTFECKWFEVWWNPGSWCRLEEWVFDYNKCYNGCHIFDVGFWGFCIFRGGCQNLPLDNDPEQGYDVVMNKIENFQLSEVQRHNERIFWTVFAFCFILLFGSVILASIKENMDTLYYYW